MFFSHFLDIVIIQGIGTSKVTPSINRTIENGTEETHSINRTSIEKLVTFNQEQHTSFLSLPAFSICHKLDKETFEQSSSSNKILVVGASSFIGASIVRLLHEAGEPVVATEDNVNIGFDPLAWYRWEKLISLGLSPQFSNYNSHKISSSVIKKHLPKLVVFVPTPLFEKEMLSHETLKQVIELHEDYTTILENIRTTSPSTAIVLISLLEPYGSYKSLIKLFELTLSVYHHLYNIPTVIIRTEGVYGPWQSVATSPDSLSCFINDLVDQIKLQLLNKSLSPCTIYDTREFIKAQSEKSQRLLVTEKWKEEYDEYRSNQNRGVVASTYITTRRNAQYAIEFNNNNYFFMENWFKNIYKMGLYMVVFHDDLSSTFVSTFKENYERSDFVEIRNFKNLSPNDRRFSAFYDYILAHPEIEYFLMTDMRDLIIQNDPFEVMKVVGDFAYVGVDEPFQHLPKFSYIPRLFRRCFSGMSYSKELDMLGFFNAGAIGGSRHVVLALLTRFNQYLDRSTKQNCNMGVVEYIFHKFFFENTVYGWPFNAGFLTHQPSIPGLAVLHKWTMDSYN